MSPTCGQNIEAAEAEWGEGGVGKVQEDGFRGRGMIEVGPLEERAQRG